MACKYGSPGPGFEPPPIPWSMHAEGNFVSTEFPHDQPVIYLEPYDKDEFVLGMKVRVALTSEQQVMADRAKLISKEVRGFNVEAARMTRKQLTFLRDRINSLLETK
jgi:hypothetical protein